MVESAVAAPRIGRINWLLSATGFAVLGQGMAITAAPLLAADLSRSPLAVSAITAATYAAALLVGLPAGALVDRWPLRRVMVTTDLIRFAVLAVFAWLLVSGFASIWLLIVLVFVIGVGNAFFDPAAQAAIPGVVGRDPAQLAKANGKLWALDTFGRSLAGPPLGAAAFAAAAVFPFGVQSLAFLISGLLLTRLREPRALSRAPRNRSLRAEIREGVTFLAREKTLRALTLGTAAYNFCFNMAAATFVLFAQDRLGLSSLAYGVLISMSAVGGVMGGWVGARLSTRLAAYRMIALAIGVQAGAWSLIFFSQNVVAAGLGLLLVGVASTSISVVVGGARQLVTPDDKLGRVVSAARVLGTGAAAVGALTGGALAQTSGQITTPLWVASVLLIIAVVPFALLGRRS